MQQVELKWWHFASCQNFHINWFFDEYENDPVVAQTVDSICINCPVRQLCAAEAEDNKETGVWGGIYFDKGRVDQARNQHKTDYIWKLVNQY